MQAFERSGATKCVSRRYRDKAKNSAFTRLFCRDVSPRPWQGEKSCETRQIPKLVRRTITQDVGTWLTDRPPFTKYRRRPVPGCRGFFVFSGEKLEVRFRRYLQKRCESLVINAVLAF